MNLLLLATEHPETLSSAIFVHGVASRSPEDAKAFGARFPEMTARFMAFQKELADTVLTDAERTARQRRMWMEEYFPFLLANPQDLEGEAGGGFPGAALQSSAHAADEPRSAEFDARPSLGRITARALVIAGSRRMRRRPPR